MHILTLDHELRLASNDLITPGKYIAEDINGSQLLFHAGGGQMTPLTEKRPFDETKDWNGKSILVVRVGGLGDLTLLTPVLREIKRRWPQAHLSISCMKEFGQALQHLPYINEILAFPVKLEEAEKFDAWIFYENAIERNPDAKTMHSVDVYAKMIGLSDCDEFHKRQDYRVTMREQIWAEEAFPRTEGKRRLVVQVSASARCRTYPEKKLQEVVHTMLQKGWEVFLMDRPGTMKVDEPPPGLILMADGYNFRQRCAVIANSDCVLAPDSSLAHIAGALGIPCIALYGPFPWQVRTKYSPTTLGINGVGKCAPCFHHVHLNNHFPKNCPSASKGICEVLDSIPPVRIVAKIETLAKGFKFEVIEGGKEEKPSDEPASVT